MKPQAQTHEVLSVGVARDRNFTVKVGAHIMRILSNLYTNPVKAIVREYLSNMYDAYVPLLKSGAVVQPPVLRLPGAFRQTLEFQDFGVGMDFETVWEVYSQYGNTTKDSTNDEVGGFGLGSKAAFCYNEGSPWNIIAVKNGIKNTFMAFVGSDGVPQLSHVSREEGTFPNGVTVSIPIRQKDIVQVHEAAKELIPYFELDLVVEGMDEKDYTKTPSLAHDNWKIYPSRSTNYYAQASLTIVMGNVPYTVPSSQFNINKYPVLGSNIDIVVRVNIGDFEITPSRDSIQWSDLSKNRLSSLLTNLQNSITTYISSELSSKPTLWEAHTFLKSFPKINLKYVWRGTEVSLDGVTMAADTLGVTGAELWVNTGSSITPTKSLDKRKIPLDKHTLVYINDMSKFSTGIILREYIRTHLAAKTYSGKIAKHGHKVAHIFVVPDGTDTALIQRALLGIPTSQIGKFSDLKIAKRKFTQAEKHYKWNANSMRMDYRKEMPSKDPFYYVIMKKYAYNSTYTPHATKSTREYVRYLSAIAKSVLNIDIETNLYGVRDDKLSLIPSNGIDIVKHLETELPKYISANTAVLKERAFAFKYGFVSEFPAVMLTQIDSTFIRKGSSIQPIIDIAKKSSIPPTNIIMDAIAQIRNSGLFVSAHKLIDEILRAEQLRLEGIFMTAIRSSSELTILYCMANKRYGYSNSIDRNLFNSLRQNGVTHFNV